MNQTMERLKKMEEREYTILTRVLFGLDTPTPVSQVDGEVDFIDQTLNDSQKDAIRFALFSREVALIHGPPGVCPLGPSWILRWLTGGRLARPIPSSSSSFS